MNANITQDVKERHDALLACKPVEASHNASTCPLCEEGFGAPESSHVNDSPERGDMSKYTEEQLQAAIAEATAPLQAQLDEIRTSQEQASIDARFAEQTEAFETEKAELQRQLDEANAAAEASKQACEEIVAFLAAEQERIDAEAAFEARKAEVAEVIGERFSKEYVEQNLDRWAGLAAEEFDSMVADWDAAAKAAAESAKANNSKTPPATAMTASADESLSGEVSVADIRKELHRDKSAVRAVGSMTY